MRALAWRRLLVSIVGHVRRALALHEGAHGGAVPLGDRVLSDLRRHLVAIEDEPVKHEREIAVGDAPLAEEEGLTVDNDAIGYPEQLVGSRSTLSGQGSRARLVEHGGGWTLFAERQEVR